MKKIIFLLTLIPTAPLMHTAAHVSDDLTDSSMPVTLSLLSSDDQLVPIRSDVAAKYIGYIAEILDLQKNMPQIMGDLSENPIDLSQAGLSKDALHLLAELAQNANIEEKTMGRASALKVAQSAPSKAAPLTLAAIKELLKEADTLRFNPIITDSIANIAVTKFGGSLDAFKDLSFSGKSAIAKQLYLTLPESSIPAGWRQEDSADIAYGISVQDIIDYNIRLGGSFPDLDLSGKKINDLAGLSRLPGYILNILPNLFLFNNELRIIPRDAFKGFKNLTFLDLSDNKIETVTPGAFEGLDRLHELDLSNNMIQALTPGAFEGLHNLKLLKLTGNPLQTINEGDFAGLDKLERVQLPQGLITDPAKQAAIEANIRAASPNARITFWDEE